jgi:uncharacterized protein YjbI with pentapeptide repeats
MFRTNRRHRAASIGLAAAVLTGGAITLAGCGPVPPCTKTWLGAVSSNWSDPANWVENAVPGAADRACADAGSTIVIDTPASVDWVTLGGSVTIPAGITLTTANTANDSSIDTLDLQGTIDGTNSVKIEGATITGGTFAGSAAIALMGTHPNTISGLTLKGYKFVVTGDATWNGNITICDNAAFAIAQTITATGNHTVNTAGCAGVGTPRFGLYSIGTLHVASGSLDVSTVNLWNEGTIDVDAGGQLRVGVTEHTVGSFNLTDTSSQLVAGNGFGNFDLGTGTLTGVGTVVGNIIGTGTVRPGLNNTGTLNVQGGYIQTGGTLAFSADSIVPGVGYGVLAVSNFVALGDTALDVSTRPGFTATSGQSMPLVTGGSVAGPFSATTLPVVSGAGATVGYQPTSAALQFTDCDPTVYHPNATLDGMDLSGKNLAGCNLNGASLGGTNLTGTNLDGANLTETNLFNADFTNARVAGADFRYATSLDLATNFVTTVGQGKGWTGTNLSNTSLNLFNQNLSAVSVGMTGANLSGLNLNQATLSLLDLSSVNFSGANLLNADLSNSDITNVDFTNADLTQTNMNGATGSPMATLPATYSDTTCPTGVNSDANGGNCEGQFNGGGGS